MTPVDDSRLRECLLVLLIVGRGGVTHMACVVEKVLDECHLKARTVDANLGPTSWSVLDCTAGAKRLLQNWTQQNQTTQFELEIALASNFNWYRRVTEIGQMFLYPFLSGCDFNEDTSVSALLITLNSPALSDLGYAAMVMTYIPNLKIRDASLVTGLIRGFAFLFSYSSRLITV